MLAHHVQFKARVHELEVQVQQLKDENKSLRQRLLRQGNGAVSANDAAAEELDQLAEA